MKKRIFIWFAILSILFLGAATFVDGHKSFWPVESNGAVPINIQDQHSRTIDLKFIQQKAISFLDQETSVDDMEVTVSDATGFIDGNTVGIFSNDGNFFFADQVGAPTGTTITIDRPVDAVFLENSNVISANHHMNVDGSVTPQVFQIGPASFEMDITRILGYIEDNSSMDDSLFGGLPELTNGITFRIVDGMTKNIWNIKSNGEIALLCFDATYTDKAPSGFYGFRYRSTYAGQEKHGVSLRLQPGDTLQMIVSDNLTGLTDYQNMAQGHEVQN